MPSHIIEGVTDWESVKQRNWDNKGMEIVPGVVKGGGAIYSNITPFTPFYRQQGRGIALEKFFCRDYLAFLFSKDTPLSRVKATPWLRQPLTDECPEGGKQAGKTCRKGGNVKKYRISLTLEELKALRDRLVPISPIDYDLKTYAILRDLYGRLDHIVLLNDDEVSVADIKRREKWALGQ